MSENPNGYRHVKTIVGEDGLAKIAAALDTADAATFFASQLRALMLCLHPSRPGCKALPDWSVKPC